MVPEDWEVRSLGSLGEFKNGINKSAEDFGHGSPFINLMDVFGEKFIARDKEYGLVNSSAAERSLYNLCAGDVLFIRSSVKPSGVGLTTVVAEDLTATVFSGFLIRFRSNKELSSQFSLHCFYESGFRKSVISNSTVSANTNINQEVLKRLLIPLPPTLAEQERIAAALSDADALIAAEEALIQKKRAVKAGAMQRLLSGEERLEGFGGEWENGQLGDALAAIVGGGTPSRTNRDYWNGDVFWATVKDLTSFSKTSTIETITSKAIQASATNLIPSGTLIISTRMAVGKAVIYDVPVAINQDLKALFPKRNLDPKFLFYWFELNAKMIEELGSGSTVKGISLGDLKSLPFPLPPPAEQRAIAAILSDMDAAILALERKAEKHRALKAGMAQQLLTGAVRLV